MTRRRPLIVLVVFCSLIVAACGTDDDGNGGGSGSDFCAVLNQDDPGEDPGVIAAEFERLLAAAPAEIRDDVEAVSAASAASATLSEDSTDAEVEFVIELFSAADEAADRIDTWSEENCPADS